MAAARRTAPGISSAIGLLGLHNYARSADAGNVRICRDEVCRMVVAPVGSAFVPLGETRRVLFGLRLVVPGRSSVREKPQR